MPSANPVPSIFVASSNPGKITELQLGARLWSEGAGKVLNWELVFLPEFDHIPQSPEDQGSFAANAAQKALHYSRHTSAMVLADDSGLEVDWLGGAPGIFSARFAGPLATDQDNNRKLLLQMCAVPPEKRTARFVCELALAQYGKLLAQFRGVAEGVILESERGRGGFGYDPLFFDPQIGRTFAELTPAEKLARSHRGRALRALLEWLAAQE